MSYLRTPEHLALLAEQCRKRKPWRQATGPKTKEGKAIVSRNAWKGGERQALKDLRQVLRDMDGERQEVMEMSGPMLNIMRAGK